MYSSPVYCDNCGTANRQEARYCVRCGRLLVTVSALPRTSTNVPAPTGQLPANVLLKQGRYRILHSLGKGGMGAVYKVEDTQFSNAIRAVKEMSQRGLSLEEIIEAAETFKREAHMLANLVHPNLPRIYDHFTDNERWYLVMDFIEGETLEDYLRRAPDTKLSLDEVLEIGIQLCTVLSYLHTRQPVVIFRDLKPANVMLTSDGHLYLIDFGIARHFKPGQKRDTSIYVSMGYAAPEQYGKAQTTQHSDIYSLGATLHELLSGNHPSQSLFQFAPLELEPQIGGVKLENIIMQMVEMNKDKRPVSMAAIKEELQLIVEQRKNVNIGRKQTQLHLTALPPNKTPQGMMFYTYCGHTNNVYTVAWSPDGTRIASGGYDKTVQVWDAHTGRTTLTYNRHTKRINAVAWSPNNQRMASAGNDRSVQVWDAQNGKILLTYRGHTRWMDTVNTLIWSPDGKRIASGDTDGTVQVWDVATGRTILTYRGHQSPLYSVAWSPDGTRIASGSYDKTVQIWEADTGKTILAYQGHSNTVNTVAWSPDNTRIISAGPDAIVHIWDASTARNIHTFHEHSGTVWTVAWSPDGAYIASGSSDKSVKIWDAATASHIYTYDGHASIVWSVAWSPDSKRVASSSQDATIQVWQAT